MQDIPEGAVDKTARVIELIDAYRTRGHLMADTDPLNYRQRRHPDLDVLCHGLTLWDLDREFATGGFGGQQHMKLRDVLGLLRDSYCAPSASSTCTSPTRSSAPGSRTASRCRTRSPRSSSRSTSWPS